MHSPINPISPINPPRQSSAKSAIIDYLKGRNILILGFGREGKSVFNLLSANLPPSDLKNLAIADQTPIKLPDNTPVIPKLISGPSYLDACADYDLIIKSPGIPSKLLPSTIHQKLTSSTDLFLRFCNNPIIGITGTKGKSTTASLLHHILTETNYSPQETKNLPKDSHATPDITASVLAGNIGKPCLDLLDFLDEHPETTAILELSSHQLEFVHASPHIAVLLNLYEEHLDHYAKKTDYFSAKHNIFRYQTAEDFFIYGDILTHTPTHLLVTCLSQKINFLADQSMPPRSAVKTHLKGEHNYKNICATLAVCDILKIPRTAALNAISSFHGLPHRLEFIGEYNSVKYYNDSIATIPEATINALKSIPDTNVLILGGMNRNIDYHPLVDYLVSHPVANLILLPDTADLLLDLFKQSSPTQTNFLRADTLAEAVSLAFSVAKPNTSCLLSPAAASYGFFKNFEERGKVFRQLVQECASLPKNQQTPQNEH
ncbi:UDP-N-acetylmuramoyl-L-alanine--D-glutamate ligase [Candidatus Saccharibacteria bacterium]|nr:UDP-N-acetylmuramoyl-L-alanine--D-glutamate ligase [Candidatus Saccharibacteria bacterium]